MFDADLLKSKLTGIIGRDIRFFEQTDSTNKVALNLAFKGAPEGTVVIADSQTGGRGRLGRSWFSPPGKNIYTSIIIRPAIDPVAASQVTLMTGVAVAELLEAFCPGQIYLKWPNDVLANGRKICGILAESRATAVKVDYIVIGIGINVNMEEGDAEDDLRDIATSVKIETGKDLPREELAAALFRNFEKWYTCFLQQGFAPVREEWLKRSRMIGKDVSFYSNGAEVRGRVTGMDFDGALICKNNGETKRITAGEITFSRSAQHHGR